LIRQIKNLIEAIFNQETLSNKCGQRKRKKTWKLASLKQKCLNLSNLKNIYLVFVTHSFNWCWWRHSFILLMKPTILNWWKLFSRPLNCCLFFKTGRYTPLLFLMRPVGGGPTVW